MISPQLVREHQFEPESIATAVYAHRCSLEGRHAASLESLIACIDGELNNPGFLFSAAIEAWLCGKSADGRSLKGEADQAMLRTSVAHSALDRAKVELEFRHVDPALVQDAIAGLGYV